jgi:N-acetylglutamate synthase-like GNAT family acetyltransferase
METQIREYNIYDKQACLNAFKSNVPMYFAEEEISQFENFLDIFQNKPIENKTYFYVVVVGNEIIGCGGFGDKDNNGIITLAWGLIHGNYHKKGYGKLLLQYRLKCIAKRYPLKPIYIDTTQYSFSFFEKFGFKTIKITSDFYTKGMHCYDMIKE